MESPGKHLKLAAQMNNEQAVEYFTSQRDNLEPIVVQVPLLAKPWGKFSLCATKLETIYKRPKTYPQTAKIQLYEDGRDNEFMYIYNYVNNVLQHSVFTDELAAARVLEPVLKNHAGLPKLEYEAETAATTDLTEILESNDVKDHVTTLGLTAHVTSLKNFNLSFKGSYKERSDKRYEYKREGSLEKYRKEASAAFTSFGESANSLANMYTEPAQLALLEQIIVSMNATTHQFTIIVHRHLALLAAKGNPQKPDTPDPEDPDPVDPEEPEEPGEGGDGGDGEGGEGGETPGGDIHNPDTTNPPIPPFIPDFE